MLNLIEEFGYDECVRMSHYPDNCHFCLKTKRVKHSNYSSSFGEFIGYVDVFDIRKALKNYEETING